VNLDLVRDIVTLTVFGRDRRNDEPPPVTLDPLGGRAPRAPWVNGRPVEASPQADRGSP
jgi:hypothetical protein